MRFDLPHPLAGRVPQVNAPIVMSRTPLEPALPPPLLGEQTRKVLRERLSLSDAQVARLVADGIVESRQP